jgi:hypothetical protein
MDMLEVHKDALSSSVVPYHKFLNYYKATACVVYGFVEGKEDPSFYRGKIESYLDEKWDVVLIPAGKKDKVLEAFNEMDWSRFPKKRVCFFVDRDLSDFLDREKPSAENLYVTDNYSIENDVITFGTMARVLEEVLNITELDPKETELVKKLFHFNLSTFREAMVPVMSQILIWRRNGAKAELNDINIKKIFKFESGKINLEETFASSISRVEYAAKCVSAEMATVDDLTKAEKEFREKLGPEKYTRGKYLLWFFIECANKIHGEIPKFCIKHSTPPKKRLSLGFSNSMVTVAPLTRCPKSLRIFIECNYLEYVREVELAV